MLQMTSCDTLPKALVVSMNRAWMRLPLLFASWNWNWRRWSWRSVPRCRLPPSCSCSMIPVSSTIRVRRLVMMIEKSLKTVLHSAMGR
eukprot:2523518-Rhodomonas_salina.1